MSILNKLPCVRKNFIRLHEVMFHMIQKRHFSQDCNGNTFCIYRSQDVEKKRVTRHGVVCVNRGGNYDKMF